MKSQVILRIIGICTFAAVSCTGVSCKSTKDTPLSTDEYVDYTDDPFDAAGNYDTNWVANNDSSTSKPTTSGSSGSSSSKPKPASTSKPKPKPKPKPVVKPKPKPKPKPAPPKPIVVTVKKGDTLYGLALKYGTTVSAIKSYNGLSSDSIRDGRTLRIPPKKR